MHRCSNCGKEYEGNFCPECGARRQEEKTCPQCGTKLEGAARFCPECGYSFADSAQKEKKPSALKQKLKAVLVWLKARLKIILPVAAAIAVIITVTCVSVSVTQNIFRAGKVSKIEMGDTQERVLKILGEPNADTREDYKWEYYSDNYNSVLNKLAENEKAQEKAFLSDNESKLISLVKEEEKLLEQLENLKYKYIEVNFSLEIKDGNERVYTVSGVLFDNARCDGEDETKKEVKKIELSRESAYFFEDVSNLQLACKYRYTDGSYKYSALSRKVVSEIVEGKQDIVWEDEWGTYSHSSAFTVLNQISGKTKDSEGKLSLEWKLTLLESGGIRFEQTCNDGTGGVGSFARLEFMNEYGNAYYLGTEDNPYLILCRAKEGVASCKVNSECCVIIYGAFRDCENLTDIDIPEGISCIGDEAFSGCGAIEFVYGGTVEQWNMINGSLKINNYCIIHCTDGDINK